MKIDIICSDRNHPVWPHLESWKEGHGNAHDIAILEKASQCSSGDLLFMISCSEMVTADLRARYGRAVVIHASDLPEGRGWSPLIWQVLEGRNEIVITLFEAVDEVDAGPIIRKAHFDLSGDELADEINQKLFEAELLLMDYAVENFDSLNPEEQPCRDATYYAKRSPEDSRLDPQKSLSEQLNLLRVADPLRYPCFFDLHGCRYKVIVEKMNEGCED